MSSVTSIWFETTTPPPGSLSCQATPNSWRSIRVRASNPPSTSEVAQSQSGSRSFTAQSATKGQPRMIASARVGRSGSRERASCDGWARSPAGPCGAQADNQLG